MHNIFDIQVIKMAHMKAVYDNYEEKLVMCLPMDDIHFITKLSACNLLPSDTKNQVKLQLTQANKAAYFLDHVIKPSLNIDEAAYFKKLLFAMLDCGYDHVVNLSSEIQRRIDTSPNILTGSYIICNLHMYISNVTELQSLNHSIKFVSSNYFQVLHSSLSY